MVKIDSVLQVQETIKRIRDFKKGFITNLFIDWTKLDNWIKHNQLYFIDFYGTSFFLKKNTSFYNVYFCSITLGNLSEALINIKKLYLIDVLVFDIVGEKNKLTDTKSVFNAVGFNLYTSLIRMSRLNEYPLNENNQELSEPDCMKYAKSEDLLKIHSLIYKYFDVYAEQLPELEDLENWMVNNHILLRFEGETLIGFLIFEIFGITSYLRYWFVHPDFRDKKVGSSLLKWFFWESRNTKRQHFWVIENNDNAIKRYLHYGFKQENMADYIFININKEYEAESYRNIK